MKGGKQPGAGRPPGPPSFILRIRLLLSDKPEVMKRGGAIWAKRVIGEKLKEKAK